MDNLFFFDKNEVKFAQASAKDSAEFWAGQSTIVGNMAWRLFTNASFLHLFILFELLTLQKYSAVCEGLLWWVFF